MKINLTVCLLFMYFATLAQTADPPPAGDGTLENPYQISTAENLYWLSQNSGEWDKHYIQTEYIDLSGFEDLIWIGNDDGFSGSYNGQGFTISNFVLHRSDDWFVGLFGKLIGSDNSNPAVLKNIVIENADVNGYRNIGGLAGYANTVEIYNCKTSGSVTGEQDIGGLLGYASQTIGSTIITYCSSSCTVSGSAFNNGSYLGGLIGKNLRSAESFVVSNSYATGNVSGYGVTGGFIGGIDEGLIENSYSRGNVTRTSGPNNPFGSFVGYADESDIRNSYSTGQVIYDNADNPTDKGFSGFEANNPVYSANFFDSETSSQTSGVGATPKTTAEMKTIETFTDAGWDFEGESTNGTNDYWDISPEVNDGYPYLLPSSDYVSSQLPNALNYDGDNDFVSILMDGSGSIFDDNTDNSSFTLELWFRIPDYANFSTLLSKHSNSGGRAGFFMESNGSGSIQAGIANSSDGWTVINGTDAVNDNQWHHTAFTYDAASNTVQLYIDGVLQSSETGFTPVFDDLINFRLASSQYYNNYSELETDEFRVWDTVLNTCEIQKYMKTELSLPRDNLIAYYRFNEGEPGGDNGGVTTLPNLISETEYTGSLYNFELSGETSNWISSGADISGTDEYFDDSPPEITSSHPNVSLALDENCEIILDDYTPDVMFTDNCDENPIISQQPEAGTLISDTTLVTLTVTDYGNNTDEVSFYVEVSDSHSPIITNSINDTLMEAETDCKVLLPDFSNEVEATDNCNIEDLTVEQAPPPGTEISGADNLITLTVSDRFGNSDQTSFLITVTDTTPPQINSTHNDTIVYIEDCQAFLPDYTSLVEAEDNCGQDLNIAQNPAAGTEIFGTENTVSIQVSDDNGNVSEKSFNVAVRDTIMPEIVCPANFSIQITKDESYYEILNDTLNYISASDNCDIVNIYNDFDFSDDLNGTQIPVGNNLISWFVEDEFGNTSVCRLSATVYNQWDYFKVTENQELNHTDGLPINNNDGKHTAISENWAIAGLTKDSEMSENAGAAYIYHKENSEWFPHIKLYASDAQAHDNFGYAVALTDSFAFVTAPYNDTAGNNCGAVYVFQNSDSSWTQTEILTPENPQADSEFGSSVDVWNDKLIVGAEGENKAYIFEYNSGQWLQTEDLSSDHHNSLAHFGHSVAIYENTAVIGAYIDNTHGSFAGSAFVFEKENDTWQQKAKLISSNIADYDEFGGSVDIFQDDIVIGAKKNSENGHYAGMAYMFVKPETGWTDTTETAQLQPSDAVAEDAFACDVGIYNERIVIGSELSDPNGMSSGSIYIFDRPLSGWDSMVETQKLTPENNGMGHYFGNSVNVYENFGIASAPGAVSSQGSSGAVFVFSMIKPAYIEQPKNLENICPEADTVIKTIVENYDTISWEISVDSGQSFNPIEEGGLFEGYDTPRLSFSASESLDSALFRCKITNYVHSVYSDTVSFYLDRIAPIIENLEAQSLVVDENCSVPLPDYTADLAITDNCNQEFTIEQSPTAGTNLTVGSYLVTINAVDSMGNYSEMVFDVDVKDTLAPLPDLNELPNITEECKIIELSAPTATDACEGEITGRHDADLPILTQGTHTVTWSYDDGNGNITTQEQRLIVEDSTLPSITCPGDQSINLEDGQSEYVVEGNEFDPTADDNCELADIVNDYNNSETLTGAKLPKGTTKVTWTAADVAGNTKKCSFDVTVNKTSASQNPTENNILVYPNPTRGKLYLEFEELNIQKIIVKDINGKTVGNFNHSDTEKLNNLTIDLSTKPAGTYILKIRYKSGVYIEKIIKQ